MTANLPRVKTFGIEAIKLRVKNVVARGERWTPALALLGLAFITGGVASAALAVPNDGFEEPAPDGFAAQWHAYNWGADGSRGQVGRATDTAHSGAASLRAESRDDAARPGAFAHVKLEPGRYALRFFAKAETGRTALVRAYLADRYSPPAIVGDQWQEVVWRHTLTEKHSNAELNLQNLSAEACIVWFDDVTLEAIATPRVEVQADTRPEAEQPRLVYSSDILAHAQEAAQNWVSRGFAGCMFPYLMPNWTDNIWAMDGDAKTVGRADQLFAEASHALASCQEAGLTENALKIAVQTDLPDPFADDAYDKLVDHFRQAARFARGAGFRMIALDTAEIGEQYYYEWPGYHLKEHTRGELAETLRARWREVGRAIAEAYPKGELALLPEGTVYSGPLWTEMLAGLLEGIDAAHGQGGVHLLCEGTCTMRDPEEIREHAQTVRAMTEFRLTGKARQVWRERGAIALGAWPLGYYRPITDARGKVLGWSGKQEQFGNKIVGPFADKSERYPIEEFRTQLAALRTYSDRYCWVQGHGSSWWQVTAEQARRYGTNVERFPQENYLVPTVANIDSYYQLAAQRNVVRFTGE